MITVRQFGNRRRKVRDKFLWVIIKSDSTLHNLDPLLVAKIIPNQNPVREAVRELRAEITFIRVHRPNQDIPTFDGSGKPIALHPVSAGGCRIENVIRKMVG